MQYSIIGGDGRQYGPVSASQLYQWAMEGRILPTTQVIDHATGAYYLAQDIPTLSGMFQNSSFQQVAPPAVPIPNPQQNPYPQYPINVTPHRPDGKQYKNKYVAGLLGIFLGAFGIHRFYLGYTSIGIIMLLVTFILGYFGGGFIMWVWGVIDGVMCLTGHLNDAEGYPLVG